MLVANRNLQSVSTCPGNKSTKEWIASAPAVGSGPHIAHWSPLIEGNRMVYDSNGSHEIGRASCGKDVWFSGQASARLVKGSVGISSSRGIEWYKARSPCMPVANRKRLSVSTCPGNKSTKEWIASAPAVGSGLHIAHWSPLIEGNRMVYDSNGSH